MGVLRSLLTSAGSFATTTQYGHAEHDSGLGWSSYCFCRVLAAKIRVDISEGDFVSGAGGDGGVCGGVWVCVCGAKKYNGYLSGWYVYLFAARSSSLSLVGGAAEHGPGV